MSKKSNIKEIEIKNNINVWKSILYVSLGIVGLKIGGDLVVDSSVEIAVGFGISQQLISLTVIAFSTSLPELITSITATIKGETDMAIGNVLGSQIFNIFLIVGVSAILNPIQYSTEYNNDIIILLMGSLLLALFPFIGKKKEMTRANGLTFITIYAIYMISLVTFTG
jgi:cation:H+ antiporter